MLIKVKPPRHSPSELAEIKELSTARWIQRRGMASVAEKMKVGDPYQTTCYGQPLPHAKEMSDRHSMTQIAGWKRGMSRVMVGEQTGAKRVPWPWEEKNV